MIRVRNVYLALSLASLTALPACSKIDNMMGHSGTGSTGASATAQPVANDMVRQVQSRLQQDGYYKQNSVDGVWGAGTSNAVQAFQRDHNLTTSGKLDVPTLQALNIADTGNNPSLAPTTGTTTTGTTTTGDMTRTPGNPAYTGPTTTNPGYTGQTTTNPGSTGPTTTTRQP